MSRLWGICLRDQDTKIWWSIEAAKMLPFIEKRGRESHPCPKAGLNTNLFNWRDMLENKKKKNRPSLRQPLPYCGYVCKYCNISSYDSYSWVESSAVVFMRMRQGFLKFIFQASYLCLLFPTEMKFTAMPSWYSFVLIAEPKLWLNVHNMIV